MEGDDSKNKGKRIAFYEKNCGGLITLDEKKIIFIAIIDLFTQYG